MTSTQTTHQRIPVIFNENYKRSGTKSYVSLLHKYKFAPTKAGPYVVTQTALTQGKHVDLQKGQHHDEADQQQTIGGRTHMGAVLQKKATGGQVGDVPAEDAQNDAQYLW